MFIVLLLLAVSHARPIGPIPPSPMITNHIHLVQLLESPVYTPDIPQFASPDEDFLGINPSFSPTFPEPSDPSAEISVAVTPTAISQHTFSPSPSNKLRNDENKPSHNRPNPEKNRSATLPPPKSPSNSPDIMSQVSQIPSTPSATPSQTSLNTFSQTPRVSDDTTDVADPPIQRPDAPPTLPTPSPFPSPITSQRTTCFPASATVKLVSGSVIPMSRVRIGHVVHVGSESYSVVHMFTHRVHHILHEFVRLTTDSGRVLTVSKGHYVYVGTVLKPAREVRVGDSLPVEHGGFTTVNNIETVVERGLYNPQTGTGDIVVNGIKASVYTEAVKPLLAHAALLPLRVTFSLFGVSIQSADHGYPHIVPLNVRSLLAAR